MPRHLGLRQKHLRFRPQTSKAKRRASAASSTWAMRMMALHISGHVKLWAGNLGGALAPVLDDLHGSPSSLLPEIGQEFAFGRGK